MNKHDKELDAFYVTQISYWLCIVDNAESEIRFWEGKRQELNKKCLH